MVETRFLAALTCLVACLGACKRSHDSAAGDDRTTVPPIPIDLIRERQPLQCPEGTSSTTDGSGALEWCERSDGTRQGPSVARLVCNGVVTRNESYRDGARDAEVIEWHIIVPADAPVPLASVCSWLAANPQAEPELVRVRASVTPYRDGKPHGVHTAWSASGHRVTEGRYSDGLADGTWRQWSESGAQLGSYEMKRGSGIETRWYDSGARWMQWHKDNGMRHGRYVRWHENGQVAEEGMFVDDLADGTWMQRSPDGTLLGTYVMKAGTGTRRTWSDTGELESEVPMKNGAPADDARADQGARGLSR